MYILVCCVHIFTYVKIQNRKLHISYLSKQNFLNTYFFVLQERRSTRNTVTLLSLNLNSAGAYRCEVSAEAPLFNTVSQRNRLNIIVLPNSRPRISGAKKKYHVGEKVDVNCTSDRSKPAAILHWYINNREVR